MSKGKDLSGLLYAFQFAAEKKGAFESQKVHLNGNATAFTFYEFARKEVESLRDEILLLVSDLEAEVEG